MDTRLRVARGIAKTETEAGQEVFETLIDFVIYGKDKKDVLAIGLSRYDSDRGGAQEDDSPGQNLSTIDEVLGYAQKQGLRTKVILLNDGTGLLLGSM